MMRDEVPGGARRYISPRESVILATHRHWVVLVEPWLTVVAGLLLAAWITFDVVDPRVGRPLDLLWWLWFALVGRAAWLTLDRHRTWFIATDRRLLLMYGVVVRQVAMMPLSKVTDMRYERTPLGVALGYGTYILESAGQDQALREIKFVPQPDEHYLDIVEHIFHKDGDDSQGHREHGGDGRARWWRRGPFGRGRGDAYDGDVGYDEDGGYDGRGGYGDDPTSALAMSPEAATSWRSRLRENLGARQAGPLPPGRLGDPRVGARHEVSPGRGRGTRNDWDDQEWPDEAPDAWAQPDRRDRGDGEGRTIYSSRREEPPRDALGYWDEA